MNNLNDISYSEAYLSDILFHFWGKGLDEKRQLEIFDSIIKKGLLLTCGNKDSIDQFAYYSFTRKQVENVRPKQWPRVCFTEVPTDKLSHIQMRFGSFGVGFHRNTILRWGGCPVWYLPNYFEIGTQYGRVSISMNYLRQLIDLLQSLRSKIQNSEYHLTVNELPVSKNDSEDKMTHFIGTLYFLMAHFKEMSTKAGDDQSFLYEKEWRIVQGLHYGPGEELFKKLTEEEKRDLIRMVPSWSEPYKTGMPSIDNKLSISPMIDDFYWFNGIPTQNTVATEIVEIIVPSLQLKKAVADYIGKHKSHFRDNNPTIKIASIS